MTNLSSSGNPCCACLSVSETWDALTVALLSNEFQIEDLGVFQLCIAVRYIGTYSDILLRANPMSPNDCNQSYERER